MFSALYAPDRDHRRCAELFDTNQQVVVPAPVAVETEWLVTSRLGGDAFDPIYADISSGALGIYNLSKSDWKRIRELCSAYADLPLGLVDASVIATAEALNERTIATLDHRHFSVVRPGHVVSLNLVP